MENREITRLKEAWVHLNRSNDAHKQALVGLRAVAGVLPGHSPLHDEIASLSESAFAAGQAGSIIDNLIPEQDRVVDPKTGKPALFSVEEWDDDGEFTQWVVDGNYNKEEAEARVLEMINEEGREAEDVRLVVNGVAVVAMDGGKRASAANVGLVATEMHRVETLQGGSWMPEALFYSEVEAVEYRDKRRDDNAYESVRVIPVNVMV